MIFYFDYPVHDRLPAEERVLAISESAGIEINPELAAKIGRPFYEVVLACTLDTETGEVTVLGAAARADS